MDEATAREHCRGCQQGWPCIDGLLEIDGDPVPVVYHYDPEDLPDGPQTTWDYQLKVFWCTASFIRAKAMWDARPVFSDGELAEFRGIEEPLSSTWQKIRKRSIDRILTREKVREVAAEARRQMKRCGWDDIWLALKRLAITCDTLDELFCREETRGELE